jgi:membrane protein YqaA with SNARE-associated domain
MLFLTYFALAVASALVPWVNAEIVMLSAVPLAASDMQLAWLVALVTIGQMVGKSIMYWLSRSALRDRVPRLQRAIDRVGTRFTERPSSALGITFVSSAVGFPPFYLVSMAAGALRLAFLPFLLVGTAGRLVHFAAVAFLPHLAVRSS